VQQASKYTARIAMSASDVQLAQAMRANQFGVGNTARTLDVDKFDAESNHVLIETRQTGRLMACFRFMNFQKNQDVRDSYSAQFYDLERLQSYTRPMIEIGRFCVEGGVQDYELLRIAWAYLTRYVDDHNIALMFGCSSFEGTDETKYTDAFALLKERHLAPDLWKPRVKFPEVFPYAERLKDYKPTLNAANRTMPPLLRTYLGMGGWVSDHAVIDRLMGTLHVFTGVEVDAIPPARARLLRNDANALDA
jgi:putative hemolysin